MCFREESRYYLCRQLDQQFDCPTDRGVFIDICVWFPGPNFTTVIIPAQEARSFYPVPYTFPYPFCGVCFEQGANSSYLPTLRQGFPDRIVRTVCKF